MIFFLFISSNAHTKPMWSLKNQDLPFFLKKKNQKSKKRIKKKIIMQFLFLPSFFDSHPWQRVNNSDALWMWPICPRGDVFRHSQSSFLPFEDREVLVSAERILITSLRALLIWAPNLWESCNVERDECLTGREYPHPHTQPKKKSSSWVKSQKLTWKKEMTGNEPKTSVAIQS